MALELNANEVFDVAERIERNAAKFFKEAASAADSSCRRMLLRLAAMEAEHEHVFSAMKVHLSANGWTATALGAGKDPGKYWGVMVDLIGASIKDDLSQSFTGRETSEEILRKAIQFEKDTVLFFSAVKTMLTNADDQKRVDGIIKEEVGHILALASELACPAKSSPADTFLGDSPGTSLSC